MILRSVLTSYVKAAQHRQANRLRMLESERQIRRAWDRHCREARIQTVPDWPIGFLIVTYFGAIAAVTYFVAQVVKALL